jgi:bifunctional UDP-N-acetylglucosamine pyrophosphorylase/glucosamine-1-phosphate N-acetyltransferase
MRRLATIILAAGKGTRMKSSTVKVLHPILGRPMLSYPLELSLKKLKADRTVVVVGYQAERVKQAFSEKQLTFVSQKPQLGSGHAVLSTEEAFLGYDGTILILCGDVPLVESDTLIGLVSFHQKQSADLTVLTTPLLDPSNYGRVVRRRGDHLEKIVEEKDASPQELQINEINTGLYCVEASFLFGALKQVEPDNVQGEYYLTDIVKIGHQEQRKVLAFQVSDSDQFLGVNTRGDLARGHEILRKRYLQQWMLEGVTIVDPDTAYIESEVTMGQDTVVHANCVIQGRTTIGSHCTIGPNCLISNSQIDSEVTIRPFSIIEESRIARGAVIGPFSRLRPGVQVLEDARVGNFVEIKNSVIGRGSKANHLAYIGDTTVGEKTNIGAGTITCNYDGFDKHPTFIGDEVFVGSNAELVAPVRIGNHAVVGAGSTITKDVPEGSLAVSRSGQRNVEGWRKKRRKRK